MDLDLPSQDRHSNLTWTFFLVDSEIYNAQCLQTRVCKMKLRTSVALFLLLSYLVVSECPYLHGDVGLLFSKIIRRRYMTLRLLRFEDQSALEYRIESFAQMVNGKRHGSARLQLRNLLLSSLRNCATLLCMSSNFLPNL
jgi:hypothetical protein